MANDTMHDLSIGWIGTGRMGFALARRLAKAALDISVWNRTDAKAEPLASDGAVIVDDVGRWPRGRDLAGSACTPWSVSCCPWCWCDGGTPEHGR